jgi:putative spermidine/putrescine transport system permease protein
MGDVTAIASGGKATAGAPDAAMAWLMLAPAVVLMAVFYFYPLLQVLLISVAEPTPGLGNYAALADSASIHRVLLTTVRVCGLTTVTAVLLGYIVAYAMTGTSKRMQRLIMALVVLPLWISALVRAFAWVVLLRREGLINDALQALGMTDAPVSMVYNTLGVVIGMVHYMLPYAILPLYANMRDIDRRLVMAARGLGASRGQAFRRVFLPLSIPGIVASGALVFVYSLGFFIIPAILGGGKTLMVAEYIRLQIVELINWGLGTALSVVLAIAVFAVLGTVVRLVGARQLFGAGSHD